MADEEIALAAQDDPNCPLLTDEELQKFKHISRTIVSFSS